MTKQLPASASWKRELRNRKQNKLIRFNTILHHAAMQHGGFKLRVIFAEVGVYNFFGIAYPVSIFVFAKGHGAILPVQSIALVMYGF